MTNVAVLAGGYGGAKMAHGLAMLADAQRDPGVQLTVIGNVADDLELHGLVISPDLDTVMYTLAGLANPETGWGVRAETWSNAEMLARYGAATWFRLGDRDLATHLVRTAALRRGASLTTATAELAAALGVRATILPVTDDPVRTEVRTGDGWLAFQDYFVRRGHRDAVLELRLTGIEVARATTAVLAAITMADVVVIAPSNPFVSVGPILAVPGVLEALLAAPARVVAVSPIVGGAALRGPADQMFASLEGTEASAAAVARHYASRYPGLVDVLVIDRIDAAESAEVRRAGLDVLLADTVMRSDHDRQRLATTVLGAAGRGDVPATQGGGGEPASAGDA